jgi:hypothetical protein
MELGVYPRAKMIIRDSTSPIVQYINTRLLDKSSQAVAQAIKRYQVPIEQVILRNNGLKANETKLMLDCLERHFEKL